MIDSYFKVNGKGYANEYFFFEKISFESVSSAYAKAVGRAKEVINSVPREYHAGHVHLISTWDSPISNGPWDNTSVIGVSPRKE